MNRELRSIIILGFSFLLVFTSFQTGTMIQQIVTKSIAKQFGIQWNGYVSLCIIYAVFSLSNWIAPSTVSLIGTKWSMVIGAATYCLFIANFLLPLSFGLYLVSVLVGLGAAIIWTAQGAYLTEVSSANNESRNSGLFWALFQGSMLFGNLFVYFTFAGSSEITNNLRLIVYGTLTAVGILGALLMLFLPRALKESVEAAPTGENTAPESASPAPPSEASVAPTKATPLESFLKSIELIKTKQMAMLSVTFFYTGIMQSFILGIYGTSIGNTKRFGSDSSKLVGISGILIGLGEITGGGLFGILPGITNRYGREPIVLLGFICHFLSFVSSYVNLPYHSSLESTDMKAIIEPNLPLALVTSFLLGLGDACFCTQIYSFISTNYKSSSSSAFSLFKFTQSIASALSFLYSNSIDLRYHVFILLGGLTCGVLSFWCVEWNLKSSSSTTQLNIDTNDEENEADASPSSSNPSLDSLSSTKPVIASKN